MRMAIILILFSQISCSAVQNFVIGFAGNIASDTVNREIEKKSQCKNPEL